MRNLKTILGSAMITAAGATLGFFASPASGGVTQIAAVDMHVTGGDCGKCASNECKTFAHYACHQVTTFCREKKSEPVTVSHCDKNGDTGCKLTNPILCATIYDRCDCGEEDGKVTCSDCSIDQDYRPKDCEATKK